MLYGVLSRCSACSVTYANKTPLNPAAHSFMEESYPRTLNAKLAATFIKPHPGINTSVQTTKLRVPVLRSIADPTLCSVMLLNAMCIKLRWKKAVDMTL